MNIMRAIDVKENSEKGSFTYQLTLKRPILGPPLADIFLGPPVADSQHTSKKCRTQEFWPPSIKIFETAH